VRNPSKRLESSHTDLKIYLRGAAVIEVPDFNADGAEALRREVEEDFEGTTDASASSKRRTLTIGSKLIRKSAIVAVDIS
jgi:hypothetical protein